MKAKGSTMTVRRMLTLCALGTAIVAVLGIAPSASAQINVNRGQVGRVVLGAQADCRVAPNGLTARGGPFTVFAPSGVDAVNVRTRVVKFVDRRAVIVPGSTWSSWKQVTSGSPGTFQGSYVWTGKRGSKLEVGHLVEFWGVRGGLRGIALAVYDKYLTVTSGAPDFGSLGPWAPQQRYCQIPPR